MRSAATASRTFPFEIDSSPVNEGLVELGERIRGFLLVFGEMDLGEVDRRLSLMR